MHSVDPASASLGGPPSDAGHTLMRHFPEEVRAAYARFTSKRAPEDADVVILAAVVDHIPNKELRAQGSPDDSRRLIADLGFDSVTIAELVFFIEDLFQVKIGNDEIMRVQTVGDLRRFVREKIAVLPPASAS